MEKSHLVKLPHDFRPNKSIWRLPEKISKNFQLLWPLEFSKKVQLYLNPESSPELNSAVP